MLLLCVLALAFGRDAGVIWDDAAHLINGENVLRWFQSGFTDTSALTTSNFYLYGALFDAPAQLLARISPWGPFETRHVLIALLGVLGIVAVFKTAALISGRRAGVLAAALLALTPAWIGHALMNPKDVPFAAFGAWAVYAAVRIAVSPAALSVREALFAGAAVGAAVGVRSGGMFLFGYVVVAAVGRALLARGASPAPGRETIVAIAARLGIALLVAWALMLSFWPWAQVSPLVRPFEAAAEAAHFQWQATVLFDGARLLSTNLPRSYLPTWFAITLPESWALAGACAMVAAVVSLRRRPLRRENVLGIAILAMASVGPVAAAVLLRPVLYDAQRHFLFVLPPAAALLGIGLDAFLTASTVPRSVRVAGAVAAGALGLVTLRDIVALHPYEYVFFNRFAGGLQGAAGRYETDYWGASYREGLEWLVRNVRAERPVRVAGCSDPTQIAYYLRTWPAAQGRFVPVPFGAPADVVLSTTRWNRHEQPGTPVHVVARDGVPLLYVIATPRP